MLMYCSFSKLGDTLLLQDTFSIMRKPMCNILIFSLIHTFKFFVTLEHPNPLKTNVLHHIETSRLICSTNQLTGFCMIGSIGRY